MSSPAPAPDQELLPKEAEQDLRRQLAEARDEELNGEVSLRLILHRGVVRKWSVIPDLPIEVRRAGETLKSLDKNTGEA